MFWGKELCLDFNHRLLVLLCYKRRTPQKRTARELGEDIAGNGHAEGSN